MDNAHPTPTNGRTRILKVRISSICGLLGSLIAASSPAATSLAQGDPCTECRSRKPHVAVAQIASLNLLTWGYDFFVDDAQWARVGPVAWKRNVQGGMVWDGNRLTANQLMHPLHGALYFNAARSNGCSYWESMAWTAFGSLLWEYLAEVYPPAPNDLINTTVGGVPLGETVHRLSSALLSARRRPGPARRVAAGLLNPMGATTNWLRSGRLALPDLPGTIDVTVNAGFDHALGIASRSDTRYRPTAEVTVRYGNPLRDLVRRPFDVFEFRLRTGRGMSSGRAYGRENPIDRLETRGALVSSVISTDRLAVGLYQHVDYFRSPMSEFGAQSLTVGLSGGRTLSPSFHWSGSLHLGAILLGASPSRLAAPEKRINDYGPGISLKMDSRLSLRGTDLVRIEGRANWLHDIAETGADHVVALVGAEVNLPVVAGFSVGGGIEMAYHATYDDLLRDPHVLSASTRFAVTWSSGR